MGRLGIGEQLALDGMALAAAAVPDWMTRAREAIEDLAADQLPFTADDLVRLVGLPRPGEGPNRNNAVGAVISGAARAGLIHRIGYQPANRSLSHNRVLAVWQGSADW